MIIQEVRRVLQERHLIHKYDEISRKHIGDRPLSEEGGLVRFEKVYDVTYRCVYEGCGKTRIRRESVKFED